MYLDDRLKPYFAKGTFPLLDTGGVKLWGVLVSNLEVNAQGTIDEAILALTTKGRCPQEVAFPTEFTVNKVQVTTSFDGYQAFLGEAHRRLCANHTLAIVPEIQDLIQRLRKVAANNGVIESVVHLGTDPNLKMGSGLTANPLTYMPDASLGATFGSQPDQAVISSVAPLWNTLKRRRYENPILTKYGAKPHYVLAHLLNHNLNGSGSDNKNVVPFWATANTEMANKVEKFAKELVLSGVTTLYTINVGGPVGMTPGRTAALNNCTQQIERDIIDAEQYLPANLVLSLKAKDVTNTWVTIVPGQTVENYVPETVPSVM